MRRISLNIAKLQVEELIEVLSILSATPILDLHETIKADVCRRDLQTLLRLLNNLSSRLGYEVDL